MSNIHAVLLDVDGTLVDSNDAQAKAWVIAMAEHGHHVAFKKVRPLIGMGGDKVLPDILGISKDSPQGKRISQRRKELFKTQGLASVKVLPGTLDLLQYMHKQGLKLVIATSAEQDELQSTLQLIGPDVETLFTQETTSQDAPRSKPDPDILRTALKRTDYSADHVLMIGDTAYDIEAAARVGVKTIALRSGGWSDQDLKDAIAIYDNPADLLKNYAHSPLAQSIKI